MSRSFSGERTRRGLKVVALVLVASVATSSMQARAQEAEPPGGVGGGPVIGEHVAELLNTGDASLADVDMYEAELFADSRSSEGDNAVVGLVESDAMAIDTQQVAEEARQNALAKAQSQAAANCPHSAPAGTLRGGSDRIGVFKLCQDSIENAATPQAALAIQYALSNLGVPYTQARRMSKGWYDCSSYVMQAYEAAGVNVMLQGRNAPTTHSIAPHSGWGSYRWLTTVKLADAKPGDLLLWVPPERTGHVAMQLANKLMVHTARTGDVSHVESDRYIGPAHLVRRVVPENA
jgi:cell wall-associated NlpC family hydrolase